MNAQEGVGFFPNRSVFARMSRTTSRYHVFWYILNQFLMLVFARNFYSGSTHRKIMLFLEDFFFLVSSYWQVLCVCTWLSSTLKDGVVSGIYTPYNVNQSKGHGSRAIFVWFSEIMTHRNYRDSRRENLGFLGLFYVIFTKLKMFIKWRSCHNTKNWPISFLSDTPLNTSYHSETPKDAFPG